MSENTEKKTWIVKDASGKRLTESPVTEGEAKKLAESTPGAQASQILCG